jgi:uncharacterized protein with HEPN domain
MPIDRDPAALYDIWDAGQLLGEFLKDRTRADLDTDLLLQSAVLHRLLLLGEAVRRLSDAFRLAHSEIEWGGFIGLRNVVIHQYDKVDLDKIWKIASEEVPQLCRQIEPLLPKDVI